MGWEPTTLYVYDEAGRLVSSQPEPEFDELEREWMKALEHYREAITCPLCGLPKSICRAPETEDQVGASSERCHVTAALLRRKKADTDDDMPFPESLAYSIEPRRPDAPA